MNETSQLLLETASAANDVYRDIATSTMSQMDIIKAAYEEEKKEVQAFFDWYALKVQPFLEEAKLFLNPGIGFPSAIFLYFYRLEDESASFEKFEFPNICHDS